MLLWATEPLMILILAAVFLHERVTLILRRRPAPPTPLAEVLAEG